jgi:hypothetical protein
MNKAKTSLLKMMGRIKENMSDYFLSWGSIYLPTGIILFIFALDKQDIWFGIMAIFCFAVGLLAMRVAWNKAKDNEKEKAVMFAVLIKEIRELREQLGGKNGK